MMLREKRIVVFGVGKASEKLFIWFEKRGARPVAIVDNNSASWDKVICDVKVSSPEVLCNIEFDYVLVSSGKFFDEISAQLQDKYSVAKGKILRPTALFAEETLDFYAKNPARVDSGEKELILERIRRDGEIAVFNYPFACTEARTSIPVEVHFDGNCSLFYAMYNGKRMYMSRKYTDERNVVSYVQSLMTEQHKNSPHLYLDNDFTFDGGVVLDAGVAEGNFALDVLDRASRLVLVEAEKEWCEALAHTFAPYKDKVTVIQKFLSDKDSENSITIDTLAQTFDFDFIKMDIEGAEVAALNGGKKTLGKAKSRKLAVCAYHNIGDEQKIKAFFDETGYSFSNTQGWMVFLPVATTDEPFQFVRGIVRATKKLALQKKFRVYIWGKGKMSETVRSSLKDTVCQFCGFIDRNPALSDCVLPESLTDADYDYIIVSAKNSDSILGQAQALGISTEKLVDWWNSDALPDFIDSTTKKIALLEQKEGFYRRCAENAPYEYGARPVPIIRPAAELLELLARDRLSLCRFGDGEFEIMRETERPWFQNVNKKLAKRLKEVVCCNASNIVIALADNFGNLEKFTENAADAIRRYMAGKTRSSLMQLLDMQKVYYDAYVSRPYIISLLSN